MAFDKFNETSPQLEARAILFEELKDLQKKVAKAKQNISKGEPKKGRQWWSLEKQRLQVAVNTLMDQIGPKLVK